MTEVCGWGRFPWIDTRLCRPERLRTLRAAVETSETVVARGLGRAYGDAAVNGGGHTILMERLNRLLEFDAAGGVIRCEAGVTFEDILRTFVPMGFFPPVTPGTKHVTVGGAVACDVHGKNHHAEGSIGRHVIDLELLLADGTTVCCSRSENPDLFWATVGGMGLTGIITEVRMKMKRISSSFVAVEYRRARDLGEAIALFGEHDRNYPLSVAWIDCLARRTSLGRSVLMLGRPVEGGELPRRHRSGALGVKRSGRWALPFEIPSFVLNRASMTLFNALYYHLHRDRTAAAISHYEHFFYPLDKLRHWNRMYGSRGFLQYQFVVPPDGEESLRNVLRRISKRGAASFLAVLKRFGPGEPDALLSFPMEGWTLALDVPLSMAGAHEMLRDLDRVVADCGGRVYLAKDACLDACAFKRMYPEADRWKEIKQKWDPGGRFTSSLGRRVGLTEGSPSHER